MRTWDIAKQLIESCGSPEDVDQVIVILQDLDAVQHICAFLTAFSTDKRVASTRKAEPAVVQRVDAHASSTKVDETGTVKRGRETTLISKDASVGQLESLFRASGMTNKQVELWITDNFDIRVNVGKHSLRKYLGRVLNNASLRLINSIMVAARRLPNNDKVSTSYRTAEAPMVQEADRYGIRIDKGTNAKVGGGAPLSSKEVSASQLESIFRTSGMTNRQVEQWITDNFGIQFSVGKDSLRKYLANVLDDADLGLTNRMLAAAQQVANGGATSASDIRDYWDELDKHFPAAE